MKNGVDWQESSINRTSKGVKRSSNTDTSLPNAGNVPSSRRIDHAHLRVLLRRESHDLSILREDRRAGADHAEVSGQSEVSPEETRVCFRDHQRWTEGRIDGA